MSEYWRLRLGCGAGAVLSGIVAAVVALRGSSQPVLWNHSLASVAAVILASLVAGVLVGGARARVVTWRRILDGFTQWQAAPVRVGSPRHFLFLLLVAVLCQALVGIRLARRNDRAVDDQADYLEAARHVTRLGGPLALPAALIGNRFHEANRHPLYVGLLALEPTFEVGKGLSLAFGLSVTVMAGVFAYRRFGPLVGGASAASLSVNGALLHSGALVACETLLALVVLLA